MIGFGPAIGLGEIFAMAVAFLRPRRNHDLTSASASATVGWTFHSVSRCVT